MMGIRKYIPSKIRDLYYDVLEIKQQKPHDPLVPPLRLRKIIGQTNIFTINRIQNLQNYYTPKSTDTILDVGCGCGGLPYTLMRYYNFKGQYRGFDIHKPSIEWLKQNYTLPYANYVFTYADIYNQGYNKKGKISADQYIFPYKRQNRSAV